MARYTVFLKQSKSGWEWSRFPDKGGWWGYYKTEGRARGAAKLSIHRAPKGMARPTSREWKFVLIGNDADD